MHPVSCSRAVPCWTWVHLQLADKTVKRCNDAKATQLLQQVYDNPSPPWESSRTSRVCCLPPVNYFEGEICCFFCLCCIILGKRPNKSSSWHYILHLMLTKSEYLGERTRIKWWYSSACSVQATDHLRLRDLLIQRWFLYIYYVSMTCSSELREKFHLILTKSRGLIIMY